ncbi:MAG: glucose/mannose-6-phosphate isomerase [Solirubrobacteraceae bacterium]|jgi:glucose/mannose-6-phosphate isomerase|nr:glucose/mannose-6-phosphate isomerase [Solirubrobacteraceae bacterium]
MAASPSDELTEQRLDPDSISAVDSCDLLADIVGLPEHVRDAKWKVESAQLTPWDSPGGLIVAGMGGSGIGGLLARAMLGDHASRPILAARTYGLPSWTTPDTTVLCASYSGNTEETLACYEAAGALGARRVAVTGGGRLAELARADGVPVIPVAGGFQPRAAVAYMTVAALEVAGLCGAGPRMGSELDVAAEHLEHLVVEWGADGPEDSESKTLARGLADSVAVIAGSGLTQPIAYRWKTQINENAKVPAFTHELPELDHNEIVGWQSASTLGRFAAVFLDDADTHPRVQKRIALTRELVADQATATFVVASRGVTAVERVFSLVLLGDLVSLYMAVLRGVDPTPVDVIEMLKGRLASDA